MPPKATALLLFVSIFLQGSSALRSRETWKSLFTLRTGAGEEEGEDLTAAHANYMDQAEKTTKHPILFQFVENCGIVCHDKISTKINAFHLHSPNKVAAHLIHPSVTPESPKHYYSIVDTTHGLAHINISTAAQVADELSDEVVDFAPVIPSFKIHENVDLGSLCPDASSVTKEIELYVLFFPRSAEHIKSFVNEIKSSVFSFRVHEKDLQSMAEDDTTAITIQVYCPDVESALLYFSSRPDVQWIEVKHPFKPLIRWAKNITQTGLPGAGPLQYVGIAGSGRIIGIADTGIDDESCYFKDITKGFPYDHLDLTHRKVVYYDTYVDDIDEDGHGTAVSGTAAGKCGDTFGFQTEEGSISTGGEASHYDGQAWDAKIAFFDIGSGGGSSASSLSVPGDAKNNLYKPLYNWGARVQSMSWGSSSNSYTNDARYVDSFMWDYHDSLILHAAGNSGESSSHNSVPNTVGSPATNKNGVSVGASSNDEKSWNYKGVVNKDGTKYNRDSLAGFSSRGPTQDGRVKPDVCAVGWYMQAPLYDSSQSEEGHCQIEPTSGTSFACPMLAGTAVLIEEYFLDGWYGTGVQGGSEGFTPSGALLKAMLIHGAQPLLQVQMGDTSVDETTWLDSNQGFGRAQVDMGLSFNTNATRDGLTQFVLGAADTSSEHYVAMDSCTTHTYNFTVVTLDELPEGQDMPSTVYATLVWTDYPGSVGSSNPLVNDLDIRIYNSTTSFDAVRVNDRRNNAEMVVLENPSPGGEYIVEIKCISMSVTQPYALVLTGENGKIYIPPDSGLDLGLSNLALTAIGVMCAITCCLTVCVYWIAYGSSNRKAKRKEADAQYATQLAEQKERNMQKKKARIERQRRKNQGTAAPSKPSKA